MTRYDAIVVGGGPAGSTAALVLARAGRTVALVERSDFPRRKVCGEFLSATNRPLFRTLGLEAAFSALAGPEIRRVALFARDRRVVADMPRLPQEPDGWGRAIGREHLDSLILDRAAAAGVAVWQPWNLVSMSADHDPNSIDLRSVEIVHHARHDRVTLRAPIIVAAHGSWDPGALPTQPRVRRARGADLFGFKAHFLNARLPLGLMPLLAFPGGYGGMVHTDHGRVSLSCCIRRDALQRCRTLHGGASAGDAVFAYIKASIEGVRDALDGAVLEFPWRAAGPIRPGIRATSLDGVWLVGNAAGEAHPIVAEGISMAMQSGFLLAQLLAGPDDPSSLRAPYDTAWHALFATRIRAASLIAHWAMRPKAVALALPLIAACPAMLTKGARTSGKVTPICSPSF